MEKLRPDDPEQLGPYKIIARLGSGGMGVVFLGSKGSRRVAVKVVRSSFLDNPSLRTRFEREIDTLKKLKSKHVAAYLDSDVDGELAWHAVEFVNGPTLREQIEHDGPMSPDEWWAFYENLKTALTDIHAFGITHRDLKPSNIILSETGIRLIDFGIAQDSEATSITTTGTVTGSPAWLSPEHLEGTELGPASDLFSAGSILVYAAKGTSPWGNETTMTVPVAFQRILSLDLRLDGLNPEFEPAVRALLVSDAASRSFTKGGPVSNTGVPRREPSENTKYEKGATQPASPPRGPSVPSRPSFTRRPEQAHPGGLTGAEQPSGRKRGRFLVPTASVLVIGATIATGLYMDSATDQEPTPSSPSATEIEDTTLDLELADPEALLTVQADSWPGRWVGRRAEHGKQWMFSEFRPTPKTNAANWELKNEPLFSSAYSNSEAVNFAMVKAGELSRWRCLDERENLATPEVRVPRSKVWREVGKSEVREVTRCASGFEELQRIQLVELEEFVGDGGCAVLRFKNQHGVTTVGCAAELNRPGTSLLTIEPLAEEESSEVGLLTDAQVDFSLTPGAFGRKVFSVKLPERLNPVVKVDAVPMRSNGTPVFLSKVIIPNQSYVQSCEPPFELPLQPSATGPVASARCGSANGHIAKVEFRFTYADGQTSQHVFVP